MYFYTHGIVLSRLHLILVFESEFTKKSAATIPVMPSSSNVFRGKSAGEITGMGLINFVSQRDGRAVAERFKPSFGTATIMDKRIVYHQIHDLCNPSFDFFHLASF